MQSIKPIEWTYIAHNFHVYIHLIRNECNSPIGRNQYLSQYISLAPFLPQPDSWIQMLPASVRRNFRGHLIQQNRFFAPESSVPKWRETSIPSRRARRICAIQMYIQPVANLPSVVRIQTRNCVAFFALTGCFDTLCRGWFLFIKQPLCVHAGPWIRLCYDSQGDHYLQMCKSDLT